MNEAMSGTPKVLKEYLDLISSPCHESYVGMEDMSRIDKFFNHPDIQYFKNVKAKNHYNYHKIKNSAGDAKTVGRKRDPEFDPYSRRDLLKRLSTFTALNWHIPPTRNSCINELQCARNGWKCVSITANNNTKNHLMCTACNHQLILKFNDISSPLEFVPFDFDIEDIQELNESLFTEYSKQITTSAHGVECPWRDFETPLDGVYYLRPYINSTNQLLTDEYLSNLKNLVDNLDVLKGYSGIFSEKLLMDDQSPNFAEFVNISKCWLLSRYYKENKENNFNLLERVPMWFYKIAVLGWDLHTQSFSNQLVLLLICSKCNKRVFLNSVHHEPIEKGNAIEVSNLGMNLSSSGVLSPCKIPAVFQGPNHPHDSMYTESGPDEFVDDLEKEKIDLIEEHEPWCCSIRSSQGSVCLYQYYVNIVVASGNIQRDGKFDIDSDINVSNLLCSNQKRKNSFDINEDLDRFSKLRKLYLAENI